MKDRMITRTIKNTSALVKLYDLNTDEITTAWLDITGNFSTDEEIIKACENRLKGSFTKFLKLVDKRTTEKLYAMPEATFMLQAQEIPARNIKDEDED